MDEPSAVSLRLAQRALARHVDTYVSEVQRLLDAGRTLMGRTGTSGSPKVADIVAEAGLSNDAFYRHFPSKAALVEAILEDGAQRLSTYAAHQMAKTDDPAAKVGAWVDAVMSQAQPEVAALARAVVANVGAAGHTGPHVAGPRLADLLVEPFRALGSTSPHLHARLSAYAALGALRDALWDQAEAGSLPLADLVDFLLGGARGA